VATEARLWMRRAPTWANGIPRGCCASGAGSLESRSVAPSVDFVHNIAERAHPLHGRPSSHASRASRRRGCDGVEGRHHVRIVGVDLVRGREVARGAAGDDLRQRAPRCHRDNSRWRQNAQPDEQPADESANGSKNAVVPCCWGRCCCWRRRRGHHCTWDSGSLNLLRRSPPS
jgi:hypothetical protein